MGQFKSAKELFWDHYCNYYLIVREGSLEEYEQLGGSTEKEQVWRDEYISYWSAKLDTVDLGALFQLRNAEVHEAIPALLKMENYGDDYAKFWFAFTLADFSKLKLAERQKAALAREKAEALWMQIIVEPVGITSEHKDEITPEMLEAFQAKDVDEYIKNYAKHKLKEI